jgi:anti-sigma factor RsiW
MTPDRLEALLWERVDGTIAADDLAELEAFLAAHPEAQALEHEVARLAGLLDERTRLAPPAELRGRIERALATAEQPAGEAHTVRTFGPRAGMPQRLWWWLPVAASLVVGVAIGYLLHSGVAGPVDVLDAAGAMQASPVHEASAAFELEAGQGRVVVTRVGVEVSLDLTLHSEAELELVVEAESGSLAAAALTSGASRPASLTMAGGRAVFTTHGPSMHRVSVTADEAGAALRLQVLVDGVLVEERSIAPSRQGGGP